MTWTYSGDPSVSNKDAVRFSIGDTNSSAQQLQDEEINWLLTVHGSVRAATIAAARTLATKYAGLVDKAVGDLRLSLSQKHKGYLEVIKQLEANAALVAIPFAGGISADDVQNRDEDDDRVKPRFTRDLHEYGAPTSDD